MTSPRETYSELAKQEEKAFSYAMQLAFGSVLPMAMKTASELGIFDIIAKAGAAAKLSAMDIAARLPLTDGDGVSLGPVLTVAQDKVYLESWSALKDAVLDGGTAFDRVHGMHVYEYPNNDPGFGRNFNMAVMNHRTIVIRKLLESYKGFEQIKQLIDIGGGLGLTLNIITSKYPHIKGVNFDLPRVIEEAQSYPGTKYHSLF
ncbi:hypothetical protein Tsubulata_045108 [Turnera subulata]|uniref:O-methyltransferase domain-containing protein n=1 Tax=Turnera subulata TaxID=218843 RepID=A0A9Q0JAK5_9ROSI|nr:hypothetical protein Tsubulata_045108 [Turnera subulata]